MKNLNGKELMRGDSVLLAAPDNTVVVGQIHQFYDRNDAIRVSGYPFQVPAKDTVLAQDAWNAFAVPLIKAREEADRQRLLDEAKAKEVAIAAPQKPAEGSGQPETSQTTTQGSSTP